MSTPVFFAPASDEESHESLAKKAENVFMKIGLDKHIEKDSFVAIKIHFGEKGNNGYIKPPWLLGIIDRIREKTSRAFMSDTNTLYLGRRSNSVDHLLLAKEHGFSLDALGIPVIIADGLIGRNGDEIQINLPWVKSAKVASVFLNTDVLLCVSHFTGHIQTGFGATIKNLGMGCASRAGKLEQHSDVHPWVNSKLCKNCSICQDYCPEEAIIQKDGNSYIIEDKCIGCGECLVVCTTGAVKMRWDSDAIRVQEKMSEYAYSVYSIFKGKIGFINFLVRITKDCDCMSQKERKIVEDIGVLASVDPVALDKASVDLVLERSSKDILKANYDVNWEIQLKHGEKIGLGSTDYRLVELT